MKKITALDIIQRKPIYKHDISVFKNFQGKKVWITGILGSIGWELATTLLKYGANVGGIDCNEEKVAKVISQKKMSGRIIPGMFWDVNPFTEDYIFHCAAFKHVRLGGLNTVGYYDNNAKMVEHLLQRLSCSNARFILVSTDKASNTSIMGQTKKNAEEYVALHHQTSVRLVNVAYSHGSVLDLWSKSKLPKICRTDVSRYWMQASDAVYALCVSALMLPGIFTVHHVPEFTMKHMKDAWNKEFGLKRWKEFVMSNELIKENLVGPGEKLVPQNDILARIEEC